MNKKRIWSLTATAAAIGLALAGCGGSGGAAVEEEVVPNVGMLNLDVSDGPTHDFSKVCLEFNEIALRQGSNWTSFEFDPAEKVNLMEFQGGNSKPVLVGEQMTAGTYEEIRLVLNAARGANGGLGDSGGDDCDGEGSYVTRKSGEVANLYVPSGGQSGVKFKGDVTIPVNRTAAYTLEIDLGRSFLEPPGQSPDVKMKPVVRVVANNETGILVGVVDAKLAAAEECQPEVYVYDDGVVPNPINDSDEADPEDPIATAIVSEEMLENGSTEWRYEIGFLLAGSYEAAFTCDGKSFAPEAGKEAIIEAGLVEKVDFGPDDVPEPPPEEGGST